MKLFKILIVISGFIPLAAIASWQVVGATPSTATPVVVSAPAVSPVSTPAPAVTKKATASGFTALPSPAIVKLGVPFEHTGLPTPAVFAPADPFQVMLFPGSLKTNLERIMRTQPWTLLWNVPYDYEVVGRASVRGKDLYDALNQILKDYPVRATFYQGNHIVTITAMPGARG